MDVKNDIVVISKYKIIAGKGHRGDGSKGLPLSLLPAEFARFLTIVEALDPYPATPA